MPETQHDVEQLKKENEESMKIKSSQESNKEPMEIKSSEESNKEPMEIKSSEESTKELIEIKSLEEDENTTDWFDRNKFKKVLVIIESNKLNHKNKMG